MVWNSQVIGSVLLSLSSRDLKAILVRVDRLARLQQAYADAAPRELARRSRVAYEREGTVVVSADTSAVAAKLRQLAPRIVIGIVKSDPEITGLRVELQVSASTPTTPDRRPEIGSKGRASLRELRDSLPESPLRQALDRLVAGNTALDSKDEPFEDEKSQHD